MTPDSLKISAMLNENTPVLTIGVQCGIMPDKLNKSAKNCEVYVPQ